MKVTARKNLIYDGTFHKAGESFNMTDADVQSYKTRHWVDAAKVQAKPADVPNALPPLEVEGRKKK